MTEEEAKKKWCPFARVMVTTGNNVTGAFAVGSANRFEGMKIALCIGSACMLWRPFGDGGSCGLMRE